MTETTKRNRRKAIKKAQEWKEKYGAEKTAQAIWNHFGYLTSIEGDQIVIYCYERVQSMRQVEIARI